MSSMKSVILSLIVAVALIVPARAIDCKQDPGICGAGKCCIQSELYGKCRPLQQEGGMCNPRVNKSLDSVFRVRCPCRGDLTCEATPMGLRCVGED